MVKYPCALCCPLFCSPVHVSSYLHCNSLGLVNFCSERYDLRLGRVLRRVLIDLHRQDILAACAATDRPRDYHLHRRPHKFLGRLRRTTFSTVAVDDSGPNQHPLHHCHFTAPNHRDDPNAIAILPLREIASSPQTCPGADRSQAGFALLFRSRLTRRT